MFQLMLNPVLEWQASRVVVAIKNSPTLDNSLVCTGFLCLPLDLVVSRNREQFNVTSHPHTGNDTLNTILRGCPVVLTECGIARIGVLDRLA
jgi:hypothetical protein